MSTNCLPITHVETQRAPLRMADLDTIYNAYNEIADAKDKASEHSHAYTTIIAASQGSDGAKRLAAQFIPTFFRHFPELHNRAIDGVFDLCEDDSSLIRRSAIKSLPLLCKDGPQHTIKIADVLCQLLQLDDQDLAVVQGALQVLMLQSPREVLAVLFRQGVKGVDLRERTLAFITNQAMAAKDVLFKDPEIELFFLEEVQKAMGSVSNREIEILAKIIMQTKSYHTGKLDLTELSLAYVLHITSEKSFDIHDAESVKRLLVAGKLSMPLFKRTISADPLLEFCNINVLPRKAFEHLTDKQKSSIFRLYSDSMMAGHPSQATMRSSRSLLTDLLMITVPAQQDDATSVAFSHVEYLMILLYFISSEVPDIVDNDELTASFRTLYILTQNHLSTLRQALTFAQSKKRPECVTIVGLTKAITIHNNIHTVVKASDAFHPTYHQNFEEEEFLKPKHLRNTKVALHPSWKTRVGFAKPSSAQSSQGSAAAKPTAAIKPAVAASTANSTKSGAKPNNMPGSKPVPTQQQLPTVNTNKRKADQEPTTHFKKPKILRRHTFNSGGVSPNSSSPGSHGSKGPQQQYAQHTAQSAQGSHGKKTSGGYPASFDNRRPRDRDNRISFLRR
ncbi:hypothetical protein EDD11_001665 [Mortierella claussenii]|nr:hypothetical protein EDD11_001665 [Mortierella claussenii]